MALVRAGFPVLLLAQNDETRSGIEVLATELVARKVQVMIAGSRCLGALNLACEPAHPVIAPMLMAQTFYRMANALSVARGLDPDRPPNLSKITETI